jgi:hypothetical protein
MAVKVIARAPFGHSVAIQKTSTAPMVTNARPQLTSAGSQSGTCSVMRRGDRMRAGSATSSASPSRTAAKPASRLAAYAASSRSDGEPDGSARKARAAASNSARFPFGFSVQGVVWPAWAAERTSGGMLRRIASASCRATSFGRRESRIPAPRQAASA